MLNVLNTEETIENPDDWLAAYWKDFRKRFVALLSYQFSSFTPALSLSVLTNKARKLTPQSKFII